MCRSLSTLAGLVLLLTTTILYAGSKIHVKGDVETVAREVETVFQELDIHASESTLTPAQATAIGKAKSGSRVKVWVSHAGEDECEVSVSSESPADPDIEERFLRLMRTR